MTMINNFPQRGKVRDGWEYKMTEMVEIKYVCNDRQNGWSFQIDKNDGNYWHGSNYQICILVKIPKDSWNCRSLAIAFRKVAVIREIAKVTQTKEIAEMGDMPDIPEMVILVKVVEMVELVKRVEIA